MRQLRLLRVSRARTPDAATDQISPTAGAGAEVVGIGERGAGAGGEEGRRGSGGGLGAVARGVEADGAGALYADAGVSICSFEAENGSLGSFERFSLLREHFVRLDFQYQIGRGVGSEIYVPGRGRRGHRRGRGGCCSRLRRPCRDRRRSRRSGMIG